jgi:hypothetical protein
VTACMSVPIHYQSLCFSTTAQALLEEDRLAGEQAIRLCERAPKETADACLGNLATRAGWIFPSDSEDQTRFCALMPERFRAQCGG